MSLSKDIVDRITDRTLVAYLGTSADDRPLVTPVWYGYDEGSLYILSRPGAKLDRVRENPRVCVAIQEDEAGYSEWKVIMWGTATITEDVDRINRAARLVFSTYEDENEADWDDIFRQQLTDEPTMRLLDIDIGSAELST